MGVGNRLGGGGDERFKTRGKYWREFNLSVLFGKLAYR
jgi:hypothetical protein